MIAEPAIGDLLFGLFALVGAAPYAGAVLPLAIPFLLMTGL
jgi:hypothetical protein